ncbi:deoxyguanosinetriphosphate triphosphohydrolase [Methylovirgula ligni]|uniref:dGTPase n=1 Tax=Methylovirgula ligni TaxID=569860 RepID=A0A3D9YYX9_9HYPH|nr:dNTP triphosphohydrolase [Methylovirgula ligni]QAY96573.1 deoxyguanosinetriphosphate triphosphohydrolase [Methylovirgula ligni]REF84119.1 dGTPase [Methylovirgula ligni]
MEWEKLLKLERLNDPSYVQQKHRPIYMQDIDRILFSPPFRRLANKTQVHPLYDNDHIHHRLIHSIEVATVGRSLGIEVGAWLVDERGEISSEQVEVLAGLVQTASMAHDIGNPPFGHSGEEAIASWFREKFTHPTGILQDISNEQRHEFESFEGNAQGFRILTRTEMYRDEGGLRLAFGSLGAFTKYPVSAFIRKKVGDEGIVNGTQYIGLKKYGFFQNDVSTFEQIGNELGLPKNEVKGLYGELVGYWWRRHPLAFLMEAADDICYNIMDLEDAYTAGDVVFDRVISLLETLVGKSNKAYPDQGEAQIVSRYRALAIRGAISSCVEAFKDNYTAIMAGNFPISLVEASTKAKEFEEIKKIAKNRIFKAARKTELEIYGRNVVYRALDGLLPLVDEFSSVGWESSKLSPYHEQVVRALRFPTESMSNSYNALHSLTDFVSGMTDRYAVKVADMLGKR